jgi:hypothetical protein
MKHKFEKFRTHQRHNEQLREVFRQFTTCRAPQVDLCHDPDCLDYIRIMHFHDGVDDFPCKHTVRHKKWKSFTLAPEPIEVDLLAPMTLRKVIIEQRKPFPRGFLPTPPEAERGDRVVALQNPADAIPTWDDVTMWTAESVEPMPLAGPSLRQWEHRDKHLVHAITKGIILSSSSKMREQDLAVDVWADLENATQLEPPVTDFMQIAP